MRYILSIRGGGIRGIIPACCLMKLESQLGGITRDHIAYCAGTSPGALLTAPIAAGIPAADILKVYTDRSKEIFTPTGIIADAKRVAEGFMTLPGFGRGEPIVAVVARGAIEIVCLVPAGLARGRDEKGGDGKDDQSRTHGFM